MDEQTKIITSMGIETFEEAAKKYCLINSILIDQMIVKHNRSCEFETPVTMFINGAKWQQERSYSEEEQLDLLNQYNEYLFTFIDKDEVGIGIEKEDVRK